MQATLCIIPLKSMTMLATVNVTQEDIDHGNHSLCHNCMLGRAIHRVLKDGYWPRVETVALLARKMDDKELKEFHAANENFHVSFSITSYEDSTTVVAGPFMLPELACKMADKWEYDETPSQFVNHPDLKVEPFTFEIDIPEEYLNNA